MSNNDLTLRYRSFDQMRYFTVKEEKSFEQIRLEIKNELETIDKEFRKSSERKKKGYVIRKFKSIFGEIAFLRTKYQYYDPETKEIKTICLIDNYVGLERYQRLCLHLKLEVLSELGKGKRQRDIVDQFKHANLTRTTVSHLARTVDVKDLSTESVYEDYKVPENMDKKQYIYLNVDDTYTSLRNSDKEKRDFRIRLITSHLGHVNPNLKRKELLHKRGFAEISQIPVGSSGTSIDKLSTKIHDLITTFYDSIENKQIIVNGDGAPWIKEFALNLGAKFVLDKYHLASLIYKCFPHDRKKKGKVKSKTKQSDRELNKIIYDKCSVFIAKGDSKILNQLNMSHHKEKYWYLKVKAHA